MRKKRLAATALAGALLATPAPARFAVIDVTNLQQNVQQTLQQITDLIRLLRQNELLTQQVAGTIDGRLSLACIGTGQTAYHAWPPEPGIAELGEVWLIERSKRAYSLTVAPETESG